MARDPDEYPDTSSWTKPADSPEDKYPHYEEYPGCADGFARATALDSVTSRVFSDGSREILDRYIVPPPGGWKAAPDKTLSHDDWWQMRGPCVG